MTPGNDRDLELLQAVMDRAVGDLALLLDQEIEVAELSCERTSHKGVAGDGIHVSFRQRYEMAEEEHEGCLLFPLRDAIAMGGLLAMLSEADVSQRRDMTSLDEETKSSLLEVAGFFSGSIESVLRGWSEDVEVAVTPNGCQGVAPGHKPNFRFGPGQEILVGRAQLSVASFPPFEAVVMLPSVLAESATG